jgi:hypothetical protein
MGPARINWHTRPLDKFYFVSLRRGVSVAGFPVTSAA